MRPYEETPQFPLATLLDVTSFADDLSVELWMNGKGRVFVRAYNEGGQCWTDVDLMQLLEALKANGIENGAGKPA